jgi:hypothetical protein
MISSVTSSDLGPAVPPDKEHVEKYVFEVSMEIKEEDQVSIGICARVKKIKNVYQCYCLSLWWLLWHTAFEIAVG